MTPAIISIVNRKGGVGKTTLAIAIADAIVSEHRSHCAIVDLDPQATASRALQSDDRFFEMDKAGRTLADYFSALIEGQKVDVGAFRAGMVHAIRDRGDVNCDLYPNNDRFWDLEVAEIRRDGGEQLTGHIRRFLTSIKESGRVVIIDCPPGQSMSALAAIRASDLVLCPITPDRFAIWGKDLLSRYIRDNAEGKSPKFIVSRSQLKGSSVVESIQELSAQPEMLKIETGAAEHGVYGSLAPFSDRQIVRKRPQLKRSQTLHKIYSQSGAHELRNIINAIQRELEPSNG